MAEEEIAGTESEEEQETVQEDQLQEEKGPKKKRIVRRRKSRKEKEQPIMSALRLTVESGKVEFGARSAASTKGSAKAYVIAQNTPAQTASQVSEMAKASGSHLIVFEGNTMELGSLCGKPFPVSVLSIHDAGSSALLELAKKK